LTIPSASGLWREKTGSLVAVGVAHGLYDVLVQLPRILAGERYLALTLAGARSGIVASPDEESRLFQERHHGQAKSRRDPHYPRQERRKPEEYLR
jgi:hypothetical protein